MLITATWCNVRNVNIKEDVARGSLFFWFPFFKKNYEAAMTLSLDNFTGGKLKLLNFLKVAQLHKVPHKHVKTLYYPCYLKRYNSLRPEDKKVIEDEYRKIFTTGGETNPTS